jgi:hypothetical protein
MDNAPAAMALTAIQSLQNHLTHLATSGHQANPDGALLQQQFLVAQQQFQGDVLPSLTDPAVPQTVQPILTEMNRTLRLLAMDVAFMQTSRNAQTTQHRQQQLNHKTDQLLSFCEALLQAVATADDA